MNNINKRNIFLWFTSIKSVLFISTPARNICKHCNYPVFIVQHVFVQVQKNDQTEFCFEWWFVCLFVTEKSPTKKKTFFGAKTKKQAENKMASCNDAILRELSHPNFNEALKSHNAVTFKLVRTGKHLYFHFTYLIFWCYVPELILLYL